MRLGAAAALLAIVLSADAEDVAIDAAKAQDATFSPDRSKVAIRCGDRMLRLFELPSGRKKVEIGPLAERTFFVRFSRDGKTLATAGEGVEVWDATSGRPIRRVPVRGHTFALAISPDGSRIAVGDSESEVVVWHGDTEKRLPHIGEAQDLAFSADGALLASAGSDGLIRVFRMPDGALVKTLDDAVHSQFALAFSPDGKQMASVGADGSLRVYDTASWRTTAHTAAGRMPGVAVGFRTDGRVFAVFAPVGPGPRPTWLRFTPASAQEERADLPGTSAILGGTSDGELVALADGERVKVTAIRAK